MKKFFERLNDFLYDSIDYFIMIGIIGLVVLIIGWRLDLLFAKDIDVMNPDQNIISQDNNSNTDDFTEPIIGGKSDEIDADGKEPDSEEDIGGETLTITIPQGSSSSSISTILKSNKLILNESDFIHKAEEMELSNRLKAGNYEIQSGSSIETILTILTK